MKTIKINLSPESISGAIKEIRKYEGWIERKTKELAEQLAMIGVQEASIRFASAMYDGVNDVVVEVSPTDNGWVITASGQAVCFIEFGAGVYYNDAEPYPNPRPAEISKIGEYGKGHGKRQMWGYYDSTGGLVLTHGNPAAMPMWYASEEMQRQVERIVKEVFSTK